MKSIKKRFKEILVAIKSSASELALLSEGLTLLSEIQQIAGKVLSAEAELSLQIAELKKAEFREGIADSEALSVLEEIIDNDVISALEESFFAELDNHADSGIGEFLQQLLEKIGKCHAGMITNIQNLFALLEDE